jgi:hypothetical protein
MRKHPEARASFGMLGRPAVWLALGIFQAATAAAQTTRNLPARVQPAEAQKANLPAAGAPLPPACPAQGVSTLQPLAPKSGHHTVTLSWKASARSVKPEAQAVGYCLYRSKTPYAAKRYLAENRKCNDCELVNATAFDGTSCVDDHVQDGTTYYYVVTAVNKHGIPSPPSNETPPARIPSKESVTSSSVVSYPFCQATTGSK